MAKKARQRISYVLPLANSPGGHRLGVNGLAVDSRQSILYSGGRDGAICAWDLNLDLSSREAGGENVDATTDNKLRPKTQSTFRAQTQAHTHWVNDITLVQSNTALVSASSDLTVRIWRPDADDGQAPQAIGQHADYAKCLASPSVHADWVASGGLDRRIYLWDLNGEGKKLEIEVQDEEMSEKGSVYALSVSRSIIASGGPESIVRLWDPRSGQRITKFVGHTDNIRDILVNESGDTIMTASSDQTVKVWSVTAGRCMHTLTMHSDSVWSLFSDDPQLGVFYSSDRSGLVVKTDVRGTLGEMDDGLSLAVAQENHGVSKVIACQDYIWTATSSSSINRWCNIDTGAEIQLPEAFRHHRASSVASKPSQPTSEVTGRHAKKIPPQSILRISNTASFPQPARDPESATILSSASARKGSEVLVDHEIGVVEPIYSLPEETIEGQHGLVKHKLLNNRRQVLTLDTAGDVLLWDLLQCIPVKSFGKRHLEDVEPEVNTMEAVAPWCSIDTRTGRLAVVLEEYNCFDAEMYADELQLEEPVEFREDQRINLGKWILRYVFSHLIDEAIKEDEAFRKELNDAAAAKTATMRSPAPTSIQMPSACFTGWQDNLSTPLTPRGTGIRAVTPGMGIGVATPAANLPLPPFRSNGATPDVPNVQPSRQSADKPGDYFSNSPITQTTDTNGKPAATPAEQTQPEQPKSPAAEHEEEKNGKESKNVFGRKFKMGMPFGGKKVSRSASTTAEKPVVVEEKSEGSETSEVVEKEVEDSFYGSIQKIRNEYEKITAEDPTQTIESGITPSLPNETPVLKLPPLTTVIVQEETSGGSADLYRGTVATTGEDAKLIEQVAPMWLGDLLLKNQTPWKEPVKVSFVLQPWQDELPSIAGPDGNARLNANRMLRVKKILAYVAERIEPQPEEPDPDAMKPEEYLELYCYDQRLPIDMTLATLRAHVWKGGADVMLYYKSNGRKTIEPFPAEEETKTEGSRPSTSEDQPQAVIAQ